MDTCWERRRPALGAVLLLVGAVAGARLAVAPEADAAARPALSPYREGGFTVRAAAVDRRVDIASAEDGSWALGHSPAGGDVVLDLDLLAGDAVTPWWVDPADGTTLELAEVASSGVARFTVPSGGAQAWVLVVDDTAAGYGSPDLDDVRAAIGSGSGAETPDASSSAADTSGAGSSGAEPSKKGPEGHPRGPGGGEGAPRDMDSGGADSGGADSGGAGSGDEQSGEVGSTGKGSGGKGSAGGGTGGTGSGASDDGREGHPRGSGGGEGAPRDTDLGSAGTSGKGTSDERAGEMGSGGKSSGGKGSAGGGSGGTGSGASDDGREGHPRGPGGDEGAPRDTKSGEDTGGGDGPGGEAGDGPASGTAPEERRFADGPGKEEPEKPAPEKPAPEKAAPEKAAPEKAAPEKPAPEKPAPEKPAPEKAAPEKAAPEKAGGSWDALAECESSGDWSISTGNGYHGGLQFDKGTWSDFGGTDYAPTADGASKEQQIEVAEKVRDARGGYGSWPACASKLGLPR